MKILVVDDDERMTSFIKMGLEDHDNLVDIAYDSKMGEKLATSKKYDVIILDVMLPGFNGFELCNKIRKKQVTTPILMLTSLDSTDDKVTGFEYGADDYLVKPFDFPELLARIMALDRRRKQEMVAPVLSIADLEINTIKKKVFRAGKEIRLTAREYNILEMFMKHPGKVFERAEMAQKIWGFSFNTGTNVIDVHINALRKKIDRNYPVKLIHTIIGIGYVLKTETS
jgi:DNA-binding response OmpR family regulator